MKRFRETMIANALAARNRSGGAVVVPITLPASLSGDPFIVKYSLTGLAEWAASFTSLNTTDAVNAVAVDSTGVYVGGTYAANSDISLGNGLTLLASQSGGSDGFIIKYDLTGVPQWATTVPATGNDLVSGLAVDSTGLYVAGRYSGGDVVLDGGVTLPASLAFDAFIIKYDKTAGNAEWVTTVRGTGADSGLALVVDSTGVYVAGQYSSTTIVSLGNGVTLPVSIGNDAFIIEYDKTGVAQWASTIRGTGNDSARSLAVDSTGVYVGGNYSSTTTVSLGNGVTLPVSIGNDVFVIKYDLTGVTQWATAITSEEASNESAFDIAVDSTGLYVAGAYSNSTSLNLGNGVTLPISVGLDAFLIKYNLSNVAQWATTISGTVSDFGRGLALDSTGVYVTGNYRSTSTVSLGNGVTIPASQAGLVDVFTAKYNLSGVAQWATVLSGSSNDSGNGIAVDSTGVYVVGQYSSTTIVTL